jgi:ribosomal protein S18 acetylase RimI-like enzyme
MDITTPDDVDADDLATLWVDLAESQRAHGSHLLAGANRARIRQSIAQHLVQDAVRVASTDDGELLGFVMFTLEQSPYKQDVSRGVVENLFVRPADRSAGVGTDLLDAAEAALAEWGADVVALEAMADNDAGRRFYEAAGYEPHRLEFEKSLGTDAAPTGDE